MTPAEVEAYLHEHIPLSAAMGVLVVDADAERVALTAPLEPNLNHQDTAFGGSVSALAILTGWTRVHLGLRAEGLATRTVIQESGVRYVAPISAPLHAESGPVPPEAWERFARTLRRRGRARIRLEVTVSAAGRRAALFRGSYVAMTGAYAGAG